MNKEGQMGVDSQFIEGLNGPPNRYRRRQLHRGGAQTRIHSPGYQALSISSDLRLVIIHFGPTRTYLKGCSRDDIESWFYMMTEMWRGQLLWKNDQNLEKILEAKNAIFDEGVFEMLRMRFAGYPDKYKLLMRYVSSIEFAVTPDYKFLSQEHRDMHYCRFNVEAEEKHYDWEKEDKGGE
ncbi:hypothetical protein L596_005200 [Steinernema carpocapsae]|uniref:Uncharacterized protein n=1 Tax=Steinernema carpocapsae TaxID=34508 RepID=A0A4U8UYC1_STECR|nr:hypothetical protein L596_005200 [Steinernema carpocapsae]